MRNAVAVAKEGRGGEVRYLGEIDTTEVATRKLVAKLAAKYRHLTFCYEAGPTGYGLYRLIRKLGHDCIVAAIVLNSSTCGDCPCRTRFNILWNYNVTCRGDGGGGFNEPPHRHAHE